MQRPAYVLTVAKGGPKFNEAEESANVRISARSISLERAELARMTQLLASSLGRSLPAACQGLMRPHPPVVAIAGPFLQLFRSNWDYGWSLSGLPLKLSS